MLIEDVHRTRENRMIKRDALIEVQAQFFDHLDRQPLYPLGFDRRDQKEMCRWCRPIYCRPHVFPFALLVFF